MKHLTISSFRFERSTLALTALFVVALVVGLFGNNYIRYILTLWFIYSISANGLNLVMGYGDLYSLGHGGFMLIGAYGTALAITQGSWPLIFAIVVPAAVAILIGVLIGLPALRLREFSLAIVTFVFAEVLDKLVSAMNFTGGPEGIFLTHLDFAHLFDGRVLLGTVWCACIVSLIVVQRIARGVCGRALLLIARDAKVASSYGINITWFKLFAFAVAAALGAIAGSFLALTLGIVSPENYDLTLSILIFAAVMIGGKGHILGGIIGAGFIVLIPEITQKYANLGALIYALLFLFFAILTPKGIAGWLKYLNK